VNKSTLPRYLLFDRSAILEIVGAPRAVWIGLLFVLSAGIAREYDGEDLLHEPWHALIPLAAALVAGSLLFLFVQGALLIRKNAEESRPPFGRAYRAFITLFWMTAPLAWIYAIPYERFLSPVVAIHANVWTLAVVSLWRVLLMTRVVGVLYGIGPIGAFALVGLFADIVAFAALSSAPAPIINLMGGVRHTASEALIARITSNGQFLTFVTAPLWLIGAIVVARRARPRWTALPCVEATPTTRALWRVAFAALLSGISLLWIGQPEQINRREAEQLLHNGRIEQALTLMAAHERSDYPPHWDPPPRIGYGETTPDLDALCRALLDPERPEWITHLFMDKVRVRLERAAGYDRGGMWEYIADSGAFHRHSKEDLREVAKLARILLNHDHSLPKSERDALTRIAERAERNDENAQPAMGGRP
jgi:hypothetical protein